MGFIIYSDKKIIENSNISNLADTPNSIAYITSQKEAFFSNKIPDINISRDIEIVDKNNLYLTIPYVQNGDKHKVEAILEKNRLLIYMKEEGFIEYLKEKLYLEEIISGKFILLALFEYLSMSYHEGLIKMDEQLEDLFEEAVINDSIQMEAILKNKKIVSLIKRYVNYYRSIINYLEDTFESLPLYRRLYLTFENTLHIVEDVETSIYSCIEIYNSISGNKMNKTMQILTIITVFSLPLTIMTGIFGMNFSSMPLINNPYGFIISFVLVTIIIFLEIHIFKKKKFF
ncbi:CorA-like Mg2+ transporter protein [Clostridium cavendishii DSM 21758]|uniref:CorA-like Mg2+ transporter protein n=1 Tax=Clostridium cavendishii DSM 21758 TaxID=1121302 RepID=A0A1M6DME9_9CLOT|nr:CorA family divalent cation transporter [Clostridium cavendishii]SHI74426.1 CorA-like Mg2+ transporter protein [Clostridium cavendishii DSM 21758]